MNQNMNYDEQIALLTRRIRHLESEVVKLGGSAYVEQKVQQTNCQVTVNAPAAPIQANNVHIANSSNVAMNRPPQYVNRPVQSPVANTVQKPVGHATKPEKQNIENKIGKNLMAIVASILIFVSLILFGSIAFMYLSNFAKLIIMYVISVGIAVFGIMKSPKRNAPPDKVSKYKTFFTSLAACGAGATYITSLIGYFGFHIFNLLIFAVLIVAWIAGTMYLVYHYSNIFVYICDAGLIISTLLITAQFNSDLLGFIIYTVCLIALYIIRHSDNFNKDCFYFIQYPIMYIILTAICGDIITHTILFIVTIGMFIAFNFIYEIKEKHIASNIITLVLNLIVITFFAIYNTLFNYLDFDAYIWLSIIVAISIGVIYYVKYKVNIPILSYVAYGLTLVFTLIAYSVTDVSDVTGLLPFATFIIVGFVLKDIVIKCSGYGLLLVGTFGMASDYMNLYVIYSVVIAFLIISTVFMIAYKYSCVDKYCITGLFLFYTYYFVTDSDVGISSWLVVLIFMIISAFMNTSLYHKNYETGAVELPSQIIGYIINGIVMFAGLISIASRSVTGELWQVCIISLASLGLYCVNTRRLFKLNLPEMFIGIYISLKFTVLILTILNRLDTASFVISIVGILIAITFIIIGFKVRHKSFRLYGLVVSLISVAKLILFDIEYDSILMRPVGFFIAGVLCFAISFTYSKLEKTINQDNAS